MFKRPISFRFVVIFCVVALVSIPLAPIAIAEKPPAFLAPGPIHLSPGGERWAEKTLKSLSLEEKIGQLIMVRGLLEFQNAQSPAYTELRDQVRKYHIGSVIVSVRVDFNGMVLRNQPYEAAMVTNQLQRDSKLPLLIAADFERGASMRVMNTPAFPAAMAFGATGKPEYAEKLGKIVARESRAMGIHWNFFPVADVNSNPLNPIINTRSFGADPKSVGDFVAAYIKGSQAGGLMATAKHFPGHGDTDVDTHVELARVNGDLGRLHAVELPPFERAIAAGVDSIMVAHVIVPAIDPSGTPASISKPVVTGLLREQLHYDGLIVTDALDMRGLTSFLHATDDHDLGAKGAVAAFKAGNDLIVIPSDVGGAYDGLLAAAKSGELPMAEIDRRVLKLLKAKAALGLDRAREVDIEQVRQQVARPEDVQFAEEVSEAAITLVRDNGNAIPALRSEAARLKNQAQTAPEEAKNGEAEVAQSPKSEVAQSAGTAAKASPYKTETAQEETSGVVVVLLLDDIRSEMGRTMERELRARIPGVHVFSLDSRVADAMLETVTEAVLNAKAVVLAGFSVPTSGKLTQTDKGLHNSVGLAGGNADVMRRILEIAGAKTVTVAVGNPYLALDFPSVQTYMCTFSGTPASENAAVKALMGEIDVRGRLPVALPGIAERGAGLAMDAAGQ